MSLTFGLVVVVLMVAAIVTLVGLWKSGNIAPSFKHFVDYHEMSHSYCEYIPNDPAWLRRTKRWASRARFLDQTTVEEWVRKNPHASKEELENVHKLF